jgi:hypothetical protein
MPRIRRSDMPEVGFGSHVLGHARVLRGACGDGALTRADMRPNHPGPTRRSPGQGMYRRRHRPTIPSGTPNPWCPEDGGFNMAVIRSDVLCWLFERLE